MSSSAGKEIPHLVGFLWELSKMVLIKDIQGMQVLIKGGPDGV